MKKKELFSQIFQTWPLFLCNALLEKLQPVSLQKQQFLLGLNSPNLRKIFSKNILAKERHFFDPP